MTIDLLSPTTLRTAGLATNSLTAVELVTADGELVRTDAQHDPDLFWALRRGGGSLRQRLAGRSLLRLGVYARGRACGRGSARPTRTFGPVRGPGRAAEWTGRRPDGKP